MQRITHMFRRRVKNTKRKKIDSVSMSLYTKHIFRIVFTIFCLHISGSTFAEQGSLIGVVRDSANGKPVDSATVHLIGARAARVTSTDGTFRFDNISTGTDTLVCTHVGYRRAKVPVTIPGEITVSLESSPVRMEDVVVKARRLDELPPHERTSSSVTVITRDDIPERAATVQDVLDSSVGIDIRSLGGMGSRQDISIRGSTADQVRVYVDGIPLSAGGSGLSGLSLVPMSRVDGIEVYRGATPGTFGSGAIGGVVNISTESGTIGSGVNASLSYGSFNSAHQSLSTHFTIDNNRFVIAAGRNTSDNDFEYYDDRGTTLDTSDDDWETRLNSDYTSQNILARWDADIGDDHRFMTKFSLVDTDRGVSGLGRSQVLNARLESQARLFQVRYGFRELLDAQFWSSHEDRSFFDPEDEAGRRGRQDTDDDISVDGASAHLQTLLGPTLTHTRLEVSRERFESRDAYDSSRTPPSERISAGIGVETEVMLLDEALWICPRIHLQHADDELTDTGILLANSVVDSNFTVDRTVTTAALGIRWKPDSDVTLRANGGVYPRLPEFNELFGDTGDIVGNTQLASEKGLNFDTGLHQFLPFWEMEYDMSVFYNKGKDLIQRRSYGDYLISENIGKSRIIGVETWSRASWIDNRVTGRLAVAWQDAKNRSDETVFRKRRYYDKQLPYHPTWKAATTLKWTITDRIRLGWDMDYESSCYKGPSNLDEEMLDSRTIHSAEVTVNFYSALDATFEAVNLTDNHAPDRWGYPKPGRGYYLTLSWRFQSNDEGS